MHKWLRYFRLLTVLLISMPVIAENYFPGTFGDWARKSHVSQGIDAAKLQDAIEFAIALESVKPPRYIHPYPASIYTGQQDQLVGPIKKRGPANHLILQKLPVL